MSGFFLPQARDQNYRMIAGIATDRQNKSEEPIPPAIIQIRITTRKQTTSTKRATRITGILI